MLLLWLHLSSAQWVEDPVGVVTARSEAGCAKKHTLSSDVSTSCRRCEQDGLPADSPESRWGRQDPDGACKRCCDEMKEARSTATETDGQETEDATVAGYSAKLAGCCEGQCCDVYKGPREEDHTGRYMYAIQMISH